MLPKKTIVVTVLLILNLLASLAFWLSTDIFLKDFLNLQAVLTFALTFSLLLSLLSLSALLHENRRQSLLLVLPASLVTLFIYPLSLPPLLLPLIFILTTLLFFSNVRREKNLYIKPVIAPLLSPHLGLIFLSVSLMVTLIYYQVTTPTVRASNLKIPDELFNQAASFVINSTGANLPLNNFNGLPSTNQLLKPIKEEIDRQFASLLAPYQPFLPLILSLSFFLTLSFFSAIIKGLTLLITSLIFFFLKYFQVILIKKETREVETLTL